MSATAEATVNITMVTHNRLELTRICMDSLLGSLRPGITLTIVDNGSTDGTPAYLDEMAARIPGMKLFKLSRNMGVAIAANLGWAETDADYYLKLDNDIEIRKPWWLDRLLELAADPEVGLVAYRYCDWHTKEPHVLASGKTLMRAAACNGGCLVVPRRVHERCGFWNEDFGRYGFEDLDYSNRAVLAGYIVGYLDDDAATAHLGHEKYVDTEREQVKLTSRSSALTGEKMYLLNKFLFENGMRDLHVERRYLPDMRRSPLSFTLNEAYKPLLLLQQKLLRQISYTREGDIVQFDLSQLK